MQGQQSGEQLTDLDKTARNNMYVRNTSYTWALVKTDDFFEIWYSDTRVFDMYLSSTIGSDGIIQWGPGSSAGGTVRVSATLTLQNEKQALELSFVPKGISNSDGAFEVSILSQELRGDVVRLNCRMTQTVNHGWWHFKDNVPYKDFTLSVKATASIYTKQEYVGALYYPT